MVVSTWVEFNVNFPYDANARFLYVFINWQVIKVMDNLFDVLIVLTKAGRCNVFTQLFKPVIT